MNVNRIWHFWRTFLVLTVIMILCLLPSSELEKIDIFKINYEDLAVHLLMFIGFSCSLYLDLKMYTQLFKRPYSLRLTVLLLSLLLGFATEMLQYIFASLHRTASVTDWLFDLAGTVVGITAMVAIKR